MRAYRLLIIGHGSRSQKWNDAIHQFCEDTKPYFTGDKMIQSVQGCFMEMGSPSIPEAITQSVEEGFGVIALPLFLSISNHVLADIPQEVKKAAAFQKEHDGIAIHHYKNTPVLLLPPLSTPEILADNAYRRIQTYNVEGHFAVIMVYYGTKRYQEAWDELGKTTAQELEKREPQCHAVWGYGGESVSFSPQPLIRIIQELSASYDKIVIVPTVVAVGMIQTDVISVAIQESGQQDKIIYHEDAILPDPILAQHYAQYAKEKLRTVATYAEIT